MPPQLRDETAPGWPLNSSPSRPIPERNHLRSMAGEKREKGKAKVEEEQREKRGLDKAKVGREHEGESRERDRDNSVELDRASLPSNSSRFRRTANK